tara:strand:+ start:2623 stop:4095 length:1473 start_codon:yes stop_codon:yes gene_type:complete
MHNLFVFNSLTGKKEKFITFHKDSVSMYVCGPTVYSNVHLGNCRTFISFDIIYRYLLHLGYKVKYVRNITDVGHLENDSDDGDDPIIKKAQKENIEPMEVVQKYTLDFHDNLKKLNTIPPNIEPTATGHILEQIQLIEKIVKNGFGYLRNGSVYFDVLKFNKISNYGKLSRRNLEDLVHNSRTLDGQTDKLNPQDFALWKKADSKHIMKWNSPWGDGFPGWHTECSAMSMKYLGNRFDIHGGGIDLKFPHHDCEIAQSEALNKDSKIKYWFHANMLTLNKKKMSKSTGNSILPGELFNGDNNLFSKPYSPNVVRFLFLQAHYRSILDLSEKALMASEKGLKKLEIGIKNISKLKTSKSTSGFNFSKWEENCYKAMNDDFNTPLLIAELFNAIHYSNSVLMGKEKISKKDQNLLFNKITIFYSEVLGLNFLGDEKNVLSNELLGKTLDVIIEIRNKSRANRDFDTSDRIRDELYKIGITLNDSENETTYNY